MSEVVGMMCGIDKAIEILEAHVNEDQMYPQVINRMKYMRNKENGVRPSRYKHRTMEYYKCGQCASSIRDISFNFCQNCGYRIAWGSVRCLTGRENRDE